MASLGNSGEHLRKRKNQFYPNSSKKLKRSDYFPSHSLRPALFQQRQFKRGEKDSYIHDQFIFDKVPR